MSDQNETEGGAPPASSAKGNIIRAAILVLLLVGLGFAVKGMLDQQRRNREIMDVNRPNPNAGPPTKAPTKAEMIGKAIKIKSEVNKFEKEQKAKEAGAAADGAAATATPAEAAKP